ncbi:bacillithiol biosynthesis deacetylase BshB1 [Roseisolibacter agri]|uniref:Bacillithiol biosynthesis deacetylase BshB1 n=1 Tax=Roseisolibacter agri TaxID=2014610 RepID=A0AA37Q492_9BACT|nr:bacillithiol biosynthesis deacetylase BshB1 [Roseisolibacter agri]GLC26284.1 bacillithiol biosynthesis deacetylase BshB1 [Roseisolibacter agri]
MQPPPEGGPDATALDAPLDVLAIGPHRDDVELTCGGTLVKAAAQGHRTGILDLTQGEMGTRGSAELRAAEAEAAARVLGLAVRENLRLPDAGISNTQETRAALVQVLRRLRPTIVIGPSPVGRHPDHRLAAELIRDACFLAGIVKFAPSLPAHRPRKLLHAIAYREDFVKPTFVVDVSEEFERKLEAVRCYGSQFDGAIQAGEVMPNGEPLYDIVRHHAAHYGSLIRARYGEPFLTLETMRVDDVTTLQVSTF